MMMTLKVRPSLRGSTLKPANMYSKQLKNKRYLLKNFSLNMILTRVVV